jgi:hypothetical protein
VRGAKDLLAGIVFLAFGAAAIYFAQAYPLGTPMRMGSGYFPTALGWILGAFGVFLAVRGTWRWAREPRRAARQEKEDELDFVQDARAPAMPAWTWGWRPVACIVASMLAFGFLMPRAGLLAALLAMFFIAALAGREFRWREVLVLTVVMTALAVGVFVVLLKLPFQLVPGFYLA